MPVGKFSRPKQGQQTARRIKTYCTKTLSKLINRLTSFHFQPRLVNTLFIIFF